jgi:feruloyl esterase
MAAFRAFAHGMPGPLGPPIRALTFDPDARIETIRADFVQGLTDTDRWTNLSSFRAMAARFCSITVFPIRGSPLLTHGTIGNAPPLPMGPPSPMPAGSTWCRAWAIAAGAMRLTHSTCWARWSIGWKRQRARGDLRLSPDGHRQHAAMPYPGFAQFGGTPGRFTCAPR